MCVIYCIIKLFNLLKKYILCLIGTICLVSVKTSSDTLFTYSIFDVYFVCISHDIIYFG